MFMCRIKAQGGDNNQGPTLHFGNVPDPWALLMAKHEAKVCITPLPFQHKLNYYYFVELLKIYLLFMSKF
jgi:hypothetical protein